MKKIRFVTPGELSQEARRFFPGLVSMNNEAKVCDVLWSYRAKFYDGEREIFKSDALAKFLLENGFIREDLCPQNDGDTFAVNRVYRDVYNLPWLPTCPKDVLQAEVYQKFRHIKKEQYEYVKEELLSSSFNWRIICRLYGFDGIELCTPKEVAAELYLDEISERFVKKLQKELIKYLRKYLMPPMGIVLPY